VVDFVKGWSTKTQIAQTKLIEWFGIGESKYYKWCKRYGKANEHNALVPRDFWLKPWERQAIVRYYLNHRDEGYRRLTYMMIDENILAVSPSTTYRVLLEAGLLRRWTPKPNKKGTGFIQPLQPHEHWHVDVSYINLQGTFYYLCSLLDGCSRYLVHWELRSAMTEQDIETIIQRAQEQHPHAKPRIISDNGPQFIANDFKTFIRQKGMTHVRTSPYYPQSNGKIERWHKSIKNECIRPKSPTSLEDAKRLIDGYIVHYNTRRLHSAIGYVAPKDKLEGQDQRIHAERERKLEAARENRRQIRLAA
jgi:putative transposase